MPALSPTVLAELRRAAGPAGAVEDAAQIAPHLSEWRGRWTGKTELLLRPRTTEDLSRILAICYESGTPVVPQGGNTGLAGGQIPAAGEVLITFERMNQIRAVSPRDNKIVAEAGAILADVQRAASEANRHFPLSLAAEGSCTIGGNLSTNAGGSNVLRYGMARDLVLGLEIVLADGRVLDLMRGLRKDNTGYDLKQLFIGAEGTLGLVTAAALKLFPKPAGHVTAFVAITSLAAGLELLNRIEAASGNLVSAFELIPRVAVDLVLKHISGIADPIPAHRGWAVLLEAAYPGAFDATPAIEETLAAAAERGEVADAVFAKNERDREALWRLREAIPEAQRLDGPSIANDVSVTPSRIPELIQVAYAAVEKVLPGARPFSFGHLGDGNIHLAVRAPIGGGEALIAARGEIETAVLDAVHGLGGSISAEHGLGQAKNSIIARYKSAVEIELMRVLKKTLDPRNILNPGKVLPPG